MHHEPATSAKLPSTDGRMVVVEAQIESSQDHLCHQQQQPLLPLMNDDYNPIIIASSNSLTDTLGTSLLNDSVLPHRLVDSEEEDTDSSVTAISTTNSFLSITTAAAANVSSPGLNPLSGSSSSSSPRSRSTISSTTISVSPPNNGALLSSSPPSLSLTSTSSSSVDRIIKMLSLFLQEVHSSEDLHLKPDEPNQSREKLAKISLSTYHMQRLFEKFEQFHQQKNRDGDSVSKAKNLFQWVLDKIVNSSDSHHVTNSDMDILIQKFRTVVTEIEVFFKKLRNEKEDTRSQGVVVNLRYFGALNQIIFTGKSTTCQFILSSIINPPNNLRGITFNRNVNIETFDTILDPKNTTFSNLRFIDCHELLQKLEDDQSLGEYVLNQVKSIYIEKCEIASLNCLFKPNRIWKQLSKLRMRKTKLNDIFSFSDCIPNIREYHMSHNYLSCVHTPSCIVTSNLVILDLSFNLLETLDSFSRVKLPNLEILDVSHNYLTGIRGILRACGKNSLKQLYLHANSIAQFEDVYFLNYFESLHALTLLENPIENDPMYSQTMLNLFSNSAKLFYFDGTEYPLKQLTEYSFPLVSDDDVRDPAEIETSGNIPPPPPMFSPIPPPPPMFPEANGIVPPPPPGTIPLPPNVRVIPTRKTKKEVSKTKNIHWKPVTVTKTRSRSVWNVEEKVDVISMDHLQKLESIFSASKDSPTRGGIGSKKIISNELDTIIDSSLSRNLEILISGLFKHSDVTSIMQNINHLDTQPLSIEQIKAISQFVPAIEEMRKKITLVEQNIQKLKPALIWTWHLSQVKHLPIKIQLMQYIKSFDTSTLLSTIEAKYNAYEQLQNSKAFVKVLHILLFLGNYMNRGKTKLEDAQGFHLNILPKLSDTKSQHNSKTYTLIHFLAETLKKDSNGLYNFETDLENCVCNPDIVNMSLETIQLDLKELHTVKNYFIEKQPLVLANEETKTEHDDVLCRNFLTFMTQCEESVSQVQKAFDKLQNSFTMACDFFHFNYDEASAQASNGGSNGSSNSDQLLVIIRDFIVQFKKAKEDIEKEEKKNMQPSTPSRRGSVMMRVQSISEMKVESPASPTPSSPTLNHHNDTIIRNYRNRRKHSLKSKSFSSFAELQVDGMGQTTSTSSTSSTPNESEGSIVVADSNV
ncbi:hypothetical protein C9374_007880 [Naegleria lovaniensis]|uniref:FH2 domain-containing protein n=1 Tax=Naegleria lovaniensis TaxID=51637 RepID=A0AA88KFX4_NAELO|nr:uncharacterized protein C9374_007880 [Naegleria lovaniensis]KAG2378732.1 hypothetical protein C9374_007880 [Naegleria lovaniensis]